MSCKSIIIRQGKKEGKQIRNYVNNLDERGRQLRQGGNLKGNEAIVVFCIFMIEYAEFAIGIGCGM